MKKRIKAAIISTFIPGGGQIFRKRFLSGGIFGIFFISSILFIRVFWDGYNPGFLLILLALITLWLVNIADAFMGPYYFQAPCDLYCPADIRPSRYVSLISDNKIAEALERLMGDVPFAGTLGRICLAPCEPPCSRSGIDSSIKIRYLKRFMADRAMGEIKYAKTGRKIQKEIAIVGGGPAGITCAYNLYKSGYNVIVYEREDKPGGIPRLCIPNYRLPIGVIDREIDFVEGFGVNIKRGIEVGKSVSVYELLKRYDAIFLATGTHLCKKLNMGEDKLRNVYYGLPFLKNVKSGNTPDLGMKTVVVGGGDVGIDVARTALRMGSHVEMIVLESKEEMPAHEKKILKAIEEGVVIKNCWGIGEISGEDRVESVKLKMCEAVFDEKGLFRPIFNKEIQDKIECDTLIICTGQKPEISFLPEEILDRKNNIIVDKNLQTPVKGLFAGGDMIKPSIAVDAMADGLKAAESIDIYLRGIRARFQKLFSFEEYPFPEKSLERNPEKAEELKIPAVGNTNNFREIEGECSSEECIREADRCLRCPIRFGNF